MEPVGLILLYLTILLVVIIRNRLDIHKLRKELKDWQDGLFVPHANLESEDLFK